MKCSVFGVQLAPCVLLFFVSNVALAQPPPEDYFKEIPKDEGTSENREVNPQHIELFSDTQDAIASMLELFSLFDDDGDDAVSKDELHTLLNCIGMDELENEDLIENAGKGTDGELTADDFLEILAKTPSQASKDFDSLKAAFCVFDKDKKGYLTKDELYRAFKKFGRFTDEEVNEMMRSSGLDAIYEINFEDFKAMIEPALSNEGSSGASTSGSKKNH